MHKLITAGLELNLDTASLAAHWRLKARIERSVALITEPLELGGRHFDWYRVANPDVLLQKAANNNAAPAEDLDPFWAATWRAAIGILGRRS